MERGFPFPAKWLLRLLLGLVWAVGGCQQPSEAKPEDTLWRMFDAGKKGDVRAYLDCFTGDLRRELEHRVREMGSRRFRQYLQEVDRQIKGVAIVRQEPWSEGEVEMGIELVFEREKEAQRVLLRREGNRWRIVEMEGRGREPSPIPYGTPAIPLERGAQEASPAS